MPVGCFKNVLFVQKICIYFLGLHGSINLMALSGTVNAFFNIAVAVMFPSALF